MEDPTFNHPQIILPIQETPQTQALNYSGTKEQSALEESADRWRPGEFETAIETLDFIDFFRGSL